MAIPCKFVGVVDGYAVFDAEGQEIRYPYQNREVRHRDTVFHFGRITRDWITRDVLPEVGQEVIYDEPGPDMAGHLIADVYPVEEAVR